MCECSIFATTSSNGIMIELRHRHGCSAPSAYVVRCGFIHDVARVRTHMCIVLVRSVCVFMGKFPAHFVGAERMLHFNTFAAPVPRFHSTISCTHTHTWNTSHYRQICTHKRTTANNTNIIY